MMEVEWLEEAIFDLKEIGQFIAADDPNAAYRVLSKIETTAYSLEHHPQLWPSRTGSKNAGIGCSWPAFHSSLLPQAE